MEYCPEAMRAQILIGRDQYANVSGEIRSVFGCLSVAISRRWASSLQEADLRWFVIDAHGVMFGEPRPRFAIFSPYYIPAGPAVFARDRESSKQVWSAREGYPGDPAYREFYKDIGKELPEEYLAGVYPDLGYRRYSGIKYHRITGRRTKNTTIATGRWGQRRRTLVIFCKVGSSRLRNCARCCPSIRLS